MNKTVNESKEEVNKTVDVTKEEVVETKEKVDDMVSLKPNLKEHTPLSPTGGKTFICKFGVNMASMKSNLKEHTPLIHTEEKLFPASFVAKLPVRSSI